MGFLGVFIYEYNVEGGNSSLQLQALSAFFTESAGLTGYVNLPLIPESTVEAHEMAAGLGGLGSPRINCFIEGGISHWGGRIRSRLIRGHLIPFDMASRRWV